MSLTPVLCLRPRTYVADPFTSEAVAPVLTAAGGHGRALVAGGAEA